MLMCPKYIVNLSYLMNYLNGQTDHPRKYKNFIHYSYVDMSLMV